MERRTAIFISFGFLIIIIIGLSIFLLSRQSSVTNLNDLCSTNYSNLKDVVGMTTRNIVLNNYNISTDNQPKYMIDFIIPQRLGGKSVNTNLQPQLIKDYLLKNKVEDMLYRGVCNKSMSLKAANKILVSNWSLYYG